MIRAKHSHKRYANKKDFELMRQGKSLGSFIINEKNPESEKRELLEFVEMTGADKIILRWSARHGFINKEVTI